MSLLAKALVGLIVASSAVVAQPQTLTIVVSTAESTTTLKEMRRETARLIAPADLSLAWLAKGTPGLGDSFEQLVVVRFQGTCTSILEDEPLRPRPLGSLANTAVSNGKVLPFVEVDCDRTRRLIASAVSPLPGSARDTLYGRALGRVLAHELYHVLAQTTEHRDRGVSKPCFRSEDLVAPRFRFDAVSLAQMRPAAQIAQHQQPIETEAVPASATDDAAGR